MTTFTLPPWSFSMLDMFDTCPKKAFHKYLLKEKEPETEAQAAGNRLDRAFENRIQHSTVLPAEFAMHEPLVASVAHAKGLNGCKVSTQLKMGLTRQFTPCGFFDKDVWGRAALDVCMLQYPTATVIDWKSGKNNEGKGYANEGLQLKIFTLFMFKCFPRIEKITGFNVYTTTAKIGKPYVYTREHEAPLWREVLPKIIAVEKAFAEQRWPMQPGPLCGYCPVKTCQFNRS